MNNLMLVNLQGSELTHFLNIYSSWCIQNNWELITYDDFTKLKNYLNNNQKKYDFIEIVSHGSSTQIDSLYIGPILNQLKNVQSINNNSTVILSACNTGIIFGTIAPISCLLSEILNCKVLGSLGYISFDTTYALNNEICYPCENIYSSNCHPKAISAVGRSVWHTFEPSIKQNLTYLPTYIFLNKINSFEFEFIKQLKFDIPIIKINKTFLISSETTICFADTNIYITLNYTHAYNVKLNKYAIINESELFISNLLNFIN